MRRQVAAQVRRKPSPSDQVVGEEQAQSPLDNHPQAPSFIGNGADFEGEALSS